MRNLTKTLIATTLTLTSLFTMASQTPAEIVQAEFDAGNFGRSVSGGDLMYKMKDVVVTGDNEVTYNYEYATFLSSRFNQIRDKQVVALDDANFTMSALVVSLASAIERSPVDLENYNNGTVYKFSYMPVSDAAHDVLLARATVVTIKHK